MSLYPKKSIYPGTVLNKCIYLKAYLALCHQVHNLTALLQDSTWQPPDLMINIIKYFRSSFKTFGYTDIIITAFYSVLKSHRFYRAHSRCYVVCLSDRILIESWSHVKDNIVLVFLIIKPQDRSRFKNTLTVVKYWFHSYC